MLRIVENSCQLVQISQHDFIELGNLCSAEKASSHSLNNSTRKDVICTDKAIEPHFIVSEKSRRFYAEHFPGSVDLNWSDPVWQYKNRIQRLDKLSSIIRLSPSERLAIELHQGPLPLAVTPYYASLIDPDDPEQPLRKTVIPTLGEFFKGPGENEDPLNEEGDSPASGIVHRYPDRVLWFVTGICTTYCRQCTRSRKVGASGESAVRRSNLEAGLQYIQDNPSIRDVLLSGGDPLSLSDKKLEHLLARLSNIPHVEFIRIGTKVPVVLPQRITDNLVRILREYGPTWLSIHINHPDEITPEAKEACRRLADAGLPLGSQTVLMKGVNDNSEVMKELMHELLKIRVRPYYLYQCDPVIGSAHFRTPVSKGVEILQDLIGHTTGYAIPRFVIDAPGGGGKIPLIPDYIAGNDGNDLLLRNFEGEIFAYPNHDEVGGV